MVRTAKTVVQEADYQEAHRRAVGGFAEGMDLNRCLPTPEMSSQHEPEAASYR